MQQYELKILNILKQFHEFDKKDIESNLIWLFKYGFTQGISKNTLLDYLNNEKYKKVALSITDKVIRDDIPEPVFKYGDIVKVKMNLLNTTQHVGEIIEISWHFKEKLWNYKIVVNNKVVPKRYSENDLLPV